MVQENAKGKIVRKTLFVALVFLVGCATVSGPPSATTPPSSAPSSTPPPRFEQNENYEGEKITSYTYEHGFGEVWTACLRCAFTLGYTIRVISKEDGVLVFERIGLDEDQCQIASDARPDPNRSIVSATFTLNILVEEETSTQAKVSLRPDVEVTYKIGSQYVAKIANSTGYLENRFFYILASQLNEDLAVQYFQNRYTNFYEALEKQFIGENV